jgi:hypothetical protein
VEAKKKAGNEESLRQKAVRMRREKQEMTNLFARKRCGGEEKSRE